jgi:hypothetical protein
MATILGEYVENEIFPEQALSDAKYVYRNRLGIGHPFLVLCRTSTPHDQIDKYTVSTHGLSLSRSRGMAKKNSAK